MKIAINGAFSTGKTTLVKALDYRPEILSTERLVAKKLNFDFNNYTDTEIVNYQLELFKTQSLLEQEAVNFITDTSLHIIRAYSDKIRYLIDSYTKQNKYDLVIHLPPEFEIENDGIRHIDYDYQKYIDNEIKQTYKDFNIKFYEVRGTIQERVKQVLELMNKKGKSMK